jgi:hypothetical protein
MTAMATSLGACIEPIYLYDLYAIHFSLILNLSLKFVEFLLGYSFCQMFVLHHPLDIQIFHDYLRWLGFRYLSRCLMKVIVTNVGQLFMKKPDYFILPLDVPALSERPLPYRTAVLGMAFGVGFQFA